MNVRPSATRCSLIDCSCRTVICAYITPTLSGSVLLNRSNRHRPAPAAAGEADIGSEDAATNRRRREITAASSPAVFHGRERARAGTEQTWRPAAGARAWAGRVGLSEVLEGAGEHRERDARNGELGVG